MFSSVISGVVTVLGRPGRGASQVEKSPRLNWATQFLTMAYGGACSLNVSIRMAWISFGALPHSRRLNQSPPCACSGSATSVHHTGTALRTLHRTAQCRYSGPWQTAATSPLPLGRKQFYIFYVRAPVHVEGFREVVLVFAPSGLISAGWGTCCQAQR